MKRMLLFFLLLFFVAGFVGVSPAKSCYAQTENGNRYEFLCDKRRYIFCSNEILKNQTLSKKQKEIIKKGKGSQVLKYLVLQGFSKKEAVNYVFPETIEIEKALALAVSKNETEDRVEVFKNECCLRLKKGKPGVFLNIQKLYDELFENLQKNRKNIMIKLLLQNFKNSEISKKELCEKSSFTTNFETSSPERKNNICVALEKFDGVVLDIGEVFHFNAVTGERNEANGYKQAKVISGGTFVSGFGGGVCQVSTTLYNACLLAGLEILEVHSHSLPVSYIEPSFDAMVNTGSSDLIVRNNSGGKIYITTSSKNSKCKVKIFGIKNKHKITRTSEKLKIIPAGEDRIETDLSKFANETLEIGEQKRLSFTKDGFYSNGYLNFYDENGNLVETKKIRESKYNPTEGVILKREY